MRYDPRTANPLSLFVSLFIAAVSCFGPRTIARDGLDAVLVFSRTTGFRHDSIPAGRTALIRIGEEHGYRVDTTEDPTWFNPAVLRRYRAIVFLNTSGNVLNAVERIALQRYIEDGGGFVGIHAAADTEHDWPWFERLVGTRFTDHPPVQSATVRVLDRSHPSTRHLPPRWIRTDEWYNFSHNPRGRVHVLATLDVSTFEGSTMGADHPISWCSFIGTGRSWYTGGGHAAESFTEPEFVQHLAGGIAWAMGEADDHGLPGIAGMFRAVTVAEDLEDPVAITWMEKDQLVVLARTGLITLHDLTTGSRKVIATVGRMLNDNPPYTIRLRQDPTDPENPLLRMMVPSVEQPGRTDIMIVQLNRTDVPPPIPATREHLSPLRNMPEPGWFLTHNETHQSTGVPAALVGCVLRPDPGRRLLVLGWRDEENRLLSLERFTPDLPWLFPFDINQGPCGRLFVLDREYPDRTEESFGRVVRLDWIGDQMHTTLRP